MAGSAERCYLPVLTRFTDWHCTGSEPRCGRLNGPSPDGRTLSLSCRLRCAQAGPVTSLFLTRLPRFARHRACRRLSRPWVLRPRMPRIASPELLADLGIGARPEAAQVARHLHRPPI